MSTRNLDMTLNATTSSPSLDTNTFPWCALWAVRTACHASLFLKKKVKVRQKLRLPPVLHERLGNNEGETTPLPAVPPPLKVSSGPGHDSKAAANRYTKHRNPGKTNGLQRDVKWEMDFFQVTLQSICKRHSKQKEVLSVTVYLRTDNNF